MSKIFFYALLIFSFTSVYSETKETPSVSVACDKETDGSVCRILISEPFAINNEAPFKFQIKDIKGGIAESVSKSQFTGDSKHKFEYRTKISAEHYLYWFVACRYENGKIAACKTFKGEK